MTVFYIKPIKQNKFLKLTSPAFYPLTAANKVLNFMCLTKHILTLDGTDLEHHTKHF